MTAPTAPIAVAIAFRAQRELQALTHPDYSADTRQSTIDEYRRAFADAVAEHETGATRADANLTNRYSLSQLSAAQIDRAVAFRAVVRRTLDEIPTEMAGALAFFETACGVRRVLGKVA
jgi:hypothetical protein